ncbi:MAG TPA: HEAT repeat domain-containing protein, partial [Candidatus Dormibacteraeota bacterium]|nr:HEAT repeat domain-containing protein [Candidatus Dormibacteraeota bacterium]
RHAAAIIGVSGLTSEQLVKALVKLLVNEKEDGDVRLCAARSLGKMGKEAFEAVGTLIEITS